MFSLRRFVAIAICLCTVMVFSPLSHQPPASAEKTPTGQVQRESQPPQDESPAPIAAALDKKVTVRFQKTPLSKALAELSKQIGVEIVLSEHQLRAEGGDVNAPVTLEATDWRAESVLHVMLDHWLTWVPRHGVLVVLPRYYAEEIFETRALDLKGLPEYDDAYRSIDRPSADSYHDVFSLAAPLRETFANRTINAIHEMTPGPWKDLDGTGGSVHITRSDHTLIMRAPPPVLNETEQLLKAMRAFTRGELEGKPRVIRSHYAPHVAAEVWQKTLSQPLTVKQQELPLHVFVEWLRQHFRQPVWIDENSLAEEKISLEEIVYLTAKPLPLSVVLDLTLSPMGLSYVLVGDVVYITTAIVADELLYTVAHDVRDFRRAGADVNLMELIQVATVGQLWIDFDGVAWGAIDDPLPGLIVVRLTQAKHRAVEHALAELRRADTAVIAHRHTADRQVDRNPVITKVWKPNIKNLPTAVAMVKQVVEPSTWQGQGGTGQIFIVDDKVIVRGRLAVLAKVRELLNEVAPEVVEPYGGSGFGKMFNP